MECSPWGFVNAGEPDLLVLNPLTADGWTVRTMCAWLNANRPGLVPRTIVTISARDDDTDEFCQAHLGSSLYQPSGVNEFLVAVRTLLQRAAGPPPPHSSAPQLRTTAGA